ncbi:MFS transporter [Candidatus Bathyarchaeota archaeon]|nr:MFS transporter [Candidatus Bathyarchaeota archaeon]MBT7187536.1 MFS transporter [Candidatus Bathyarchaeota archaeon]MBT7346114.1 MFS transporter [Candidatus Bathyarchaeota archaeon]
MGLIDGIKKFWRSQKTNYRLMIARDSLTMFSGRRPMARGMGGYDGIFLSRLGASALQIGYVNGVIGLLNVLLAVPSGWLIDRSSDIRRLYFASFALSLPALLALYFTSDWRLYLAIMMVYTLSISIQFPSQLIMNIDSMDDSNRVSGLGFHRTVTAIAGVASPMIIAYAINFFGGLESADSIRPLFLIFFAVDIVILYVVTRYAEPVHIEREEESSNILDGVRALIDAPTPLKLLLLSEITTVFAMLMTGPFRGIYQVDIKMASIFIFGWIGVAEPAIDIFFSMPLANLVEKYGRKRTAYVGHVFGILARLVLVITPVTLPQMLITVSILGSFEGCLYVGMDAYSQEAIPQRVRGSYMGVRNLIVGVTGVLSPIVGGYIWELNPDLLFWMPVVQWSLIAFPILVILMEKYSMDGNVLPQ